MPFLDSLDIANRALQHCGVGQIATVTEDSKANKETSFAYDKVRRAELRRNVWRFAIRNAVLRAVDTTTMVIVPTAWSPSITYLPGALVSDSDGQYWISSTPDNTNNTPGDSDIWDMYFGPLNVSLYDSTVAYNTGELVYKATGVSSAYAVFLSLQSDNSDDPGTATAWSATTTYNSDDVVSASASLWRSLLPYNLNITPADGPSAFAIATTYSTSQQVTGSDNFIYTSVGNGNVGHDPTTDGGIHWTNTNTMNGWSRTPTLPTSSIKWRAIAAVIANPHFLYPVGTGPSSQSTTRNVFRLPAGFLREAPQDPKAGSISALGAPSGRAYDDWMLEGDYLISSDTGPLILRFVADVTRVSAMDDMFCEGLACRVATAICNPLTQSDAKLQTIASAYKVFMGEARTVNAIETGPEEPPLDDYIQCRG